MNIEYYSVVLILLYLAGVTALGIVASKRGKEKKASDYFFGSRDLGSLSLGASLFVTAVAGMWLVGAVPGVNILGVWYGACVVIAALVLGYWAAPLYLKSKVLTVPQFFSLRFDNTTGLTLSALSILFYVGVKIPLLLTFASWMIERVLGWDVVPSAGLLLVVILIGLYTVAGGFVSVVRTQKMQAAVVLVGSLFMAAWVVIEPSVVPQTISSSLFNGAEYSWLPYVLGLPIILAWHWLADQFVIQRILATRNADTARRGTLLGAILIFVGVVLFSIVTYYAAPSLLAGTADSTSTMWFKGLGSVVFLALLMASLASDFHSAATLFTMDFYRTVYPDSRDESLVLVGRLSTTMIVILAILAVSTVSLVAPQLIALLQQFQMHLAPPIVAVFLFGMFWKRTSNRGALWGLVIGELFGAFDLAARYFSNADRLNEGMFSWLASLNLFAFGIVSLAISSLILVGVSLLTEAPLQKRVRTWQFSKEESVRF